MGKSVIRGNSGYGYLIDWLVYFGDLCIINLLFFIAYKFSPTKLILNIEDGLSWQVDVILLINLVYFVTSIFIRCSVSDNVLMAEKILRQTIYFSALYTIIITSVSGIFNVLNIHFLYFIILFICLSFALSVWHILCRLALKGYRSKGYNYKNIVIIGGDQNAIETYDELKRIYSGYKILGYFSDEIVHKQLMPEHLGRIDNVASYMSLNKVDEVYCSLSGENGEVVAKLMNHCERNMVRFHLIPDLYLYVKKKLSLQFLETIPVLSLRLEPLQHPFNRVIKRILDILFSLAVILLIYPIIYLIIAPLIKLSSPGPVHFVQKRTGFRGREFNCLKFRSMRPNVEANKKSATKGDPRITRVGAFIRKTSIDELPQFMNVLMGDMSVVGPRPHMVRQTDEYSKLIEKYMVRHLVKPGITGWAQVTGSRGETKTVRHMEERVKKDVWYIENWSVYLDIKIIVKTVVNVFKGEDTAY